MQERKLKKAIHWFTSLRNEFCQTFEDIDGGKFRKGKKWQHKGEGGGEMSIMKGNVFENRSKYFYRIRAVFRRL